MCKPSRILVSLGAFIALSASLGIAPPARAITVSSVVNTGLFNINELAVDPGNGDIYLNGYPSGRSQLSIVKVSGSMLTLLYPSLPGTTGGNLTYTNGFAVHGANLWWNNANSGPGSATEVSFATKAGGGTITRNSPTDDLDSLSSDGTSLFTAHYAGTLYTLNSDGSSVSYIGFHRSTSHLAIVANAGILYVVDDGGAYRRNSDGSFDDINTAPNTYLTNGSRAGEGGGLLFALDRNVHNGFWEINETTGVASFFTHSSFTNLNAISYYGGNLYASDTGELAAAPNTNGHVWKISDITTASCATPPPNMVSWWPGDGDTSDIQGGNNGTFSGTVGYGTGEVGQAFSFNGGGYVAIGDPASLRLTGTSVTLDAWVNPNSPNQTAIIAGKTQSGNNDYLLYLSGGYLQAYIKTAGETTITGTPLPVNTWTHVALTYDGSTLNLFQNGIVTATAGVSGNLAGTNSEFAIGGRADGNLFDGLVDEVEVFSRGLNVAEISSIYTAGSAGKCRPAAPTPTGSPSDADGDGTVLGPQGGQATFGFDVTLVQVKKKTKGAGIMIYNDPTAGLSFQSNKITSLTLTWHTVHFTGIAKLGKKSQVNFTVDATDNGTPGTLDTFSIHLSNGYSASGNPTSGDISIH